ncbi:hypothetical protein DFH08DRAFT_811370 [Mycena albidolilacea]|uniref:DUF6589 domain-containing protein n=1 Tax=Mycena albidolilacea TaxID=1033008 RepID=A0AAD7EPD5_9AGAR|nr:hypothetical protein DFH08DRAFT_811370 [Mycena albidolilacea]
MRYLNQHQTYFRLQSRSTGPFRCSAKTELPTLDELLKHASILRERYASQTAYEQSLDKAEQDNTEPHTKFPAGSTWTRLCAPETPTAEPDADEDTDMPGLADIPEDTDSTDKTRDADEPANEIPPKTKADEDGPKFHKEEEGFDGDRVLSNSILFLMEFGWWIELNHAIPEGDVGRGLVTSRYSTRSIDERACTSNQNYMGYMLDLYALLEFECSPELQETLLDNWLFNLPGEAGKFVEGDLMQEWNNRWLEDIAGQRGGEFDDNFYCKTVAPNVLHFLKMKEGIETAFALKPRGKAHLPTSPQRDPNPSAPVNRFDRGYQRLDEGKMAEFLQRSAEYAELVQDMEAMRNSSSVPAPGADILSPELNSPTSSTNPFPDWSQTNQPASRRSARSTASKAASLAADSVEGWDDKDHSDEVLVSGSDLAVSTDPETGRLCDDWYEPADFEALLEQIFGPEDEADEESEDEEPESDEPESESEGE